MFMGLMFFVLILAESRCIISSSVLQGLLVLSHKINEHTDNCHVVLCIAEIVNCNG